MNLNVMRFVCKSNLGCFCFTLESGHNAVESGGLWSGMLNPLRVWSEERIDCGDDGSDAGWSGGSCTPNHPANA